jgi:DNA-binding NtrC family response regulator
MFLHPEDDSRIIGRIPDLSMGVAMRKYRILLVDDDRFIRSSLEKSLMSEDYELTTAESGEAAMELISRIRFDLVITDLVMDKKDGIDVLKHAKKTSPDIMVIIITGHGNITSAIKALRLNADDYMLKPCQPEEVRFRVSKCLERVEAIEKIRLHAEILPICCVCKNIRDDSGRTPGTGEWMSVEKFIWEKLRVAPTSTYCPVCAEKVKEEILKL